MVVELGVGVWARCSHTRPTVRLRSASQLPSSASASRLRLLQRGRNVHGVPSQPVWVPPTQILLAVVRRLLVRGSASSTVLLGRYESTRSHDRASRPACRRSHDIVFWLVLAPNPLAPTRDSIAARLCHCAAKDCGEREREREKSIVVPVAELGVRVWPQ